MASFKEQDFASLRHALADQGGVRSFVVARDDAIAFEHHRHDVAPESLQDINSVTKTVVALAVGAALRERLLPPLDTPAHHLVPQMQAADLDPRVRHITLRHLLDMTSGFEWDQSVVDDCVLGPCERFAGRDSRLRFIVSRPFAHPPGARFQYDSHALQLLSVALESATGRTLECYARDTLFAPLDIAASEWIGDEAGHTFGGRGLMLRARDMIRLGILMMDRGAWRGARVIDEWFIDEATSVQSEGGPPMADAKYGYLCWIDPRYFFAAGYGEQFIFVAPRERTVAAITCENDESHKGVRALFEQYVLGASG
ncbi:beta-lactamase [Caballeronia hypogeia]|uniref:Beta-lactamase n=1 Tax=Caballeronia hypogeia TaxID=1777140 RepID=A0A158CGT2_9BURK|nr:serine hydrolase domain-containing protein [Caballeronia hypogeia]SAK81554.1 beta-lactamase [Caballeronia hypogeia]